MSVLALWLSFIAIKRQWCLECILQFKDVAKTKGFLLCSDLQLINAQPVMKFGVRLRNSRLPHYAYMFLRDPGIKINTGKFKSSKGTCRPCAEALAS